MTAPGASSSEVPDALLEALIADAAGDEMPHQLNLAVEHAAGAHVDHHPECWRCNRERRSP